MENCNLPSLCYCNPKSLAQNWFQKTVLSPSFPFSILVWCILSKQSLQGEPIYKIQNRFPLLYALCTLLFQSTIRNRNPLHHALCSPILNSAIVDLCSMRYALCNFNPNSKIQNLKSNNSPFRIPPSDFRSRPIFRRAEE